MKSSLPPIDLTEDIEKYEAKHESTSIKKNRCLHASAHMQGAELVCTCGAAWSGPRIAELLQVLTKHNG